MYTATFIEREAFKDVVRHTIQKYQNVFRSYRLVDFNNSIVDPIKLLFDNKISRETWEETIRKEINRQRDKSNNNEIGTFHQQLFRHVPNCVVPTAGWDVIFTDPNEPHDKIYVELKNKHNTMNSSSAQKTYIQMQNQILNDDHCKCYLVEVISTHSQNEIWSSRLDGRRVSHRLIRVVSIDRFYSEITGIPDAFYRICMSLPEIIDEIMSEGGFHTTQNDTVIQELQDIDPDYLKSLYLLAFSSYEGFRTN